MYMQGWGKYIDSVLGYKYNKNVQVQVQVRGFAKCTWVLPKYIANVLCIQVQMFNITHKNIPVNA